MKDSLSLYNRDDFRQRYKNSFGFLPVNGVKTLVYIKEVAAHRVTFLTETKGMEYYALAGAGVEFEFLPVTRSWYDIGDRPVLLFRIPAKQWCRGINANNTECLSPQEGNYTERQPLTLEILHKVFVSPPKPDLRGFLNGIKNYFVLGRAFCLYAGVVYFFGKRIGTYVGKELVINNPLVYQELIDIMARNNFPFTVKVDHEAV